MAFKQTASGSCSVAGVSTCGSVWACPVCAHKIAVKRAMDLGRGIARWVAAGNSVVMVTFTVQHKRSDALADVWQALLTAQRYVVSGRQWQSDQAEYAIRGYHRTTECTFTWENGWHPHYHTLLFLQGPAPSAARLSELKSRLFKRWSLGLQRWSARLEREAFRTGWQHGIDIRPMKLENVEAFEGDVERALLESPSLADYLLKSGARSAAQLGDGRRMALEALAHTGKESQGGFTPFGLLGALAELEDAAAADRRLGISSSDELVRMQSWLAARWQEWERFSERKRQVTMSRSCRRTGKVGLVELLELTTPDVDDDVLAAEDDIDDVEVVAVMSAGDARQASARGSSVEAIAAIVERDGIAAASEHCRALGVELRVDVASLGLWEHEEEKLRRANRVRAQARSG
ncbi:protein rep [Gordonia sp. ABSL49_1]|uniref:protein rep n=1 Tax=Gordonia sp. ABSL49_1 TaxID=2920941 RepID=UPI001F0EC77C|nr:protein rep [Gordonia sp. ABSL49_1]MCH5643232.1 protein rep [Gordonia sp. ABSL49_1]